MLKKGRDLFTTALLLSILFHFVFTIFIVTRQFPKKPENIEFEILDSASIEKKMRALQKKANAIVDQSEKAINNEIDENAQYLSRHNQKVVRQTKAANTGKFQNEAKDGPAAKAPTTQQQIAVTPPQPQAEKQLRKKTTTAITSGDVALPKLTALKPRFDWNKAPASAGAQNPGQRSQSNDYLKDLPTGPQTLLSSREFVYYSYYARIKERIGMFWEPKIKEKVQRIFMSGRKLASDQERVTKLIIVLDAAGKLMRVQVVGEAGIKDLDDAAVEAFQAAAPFPNPPKGIVESDGTIKIQWDFILLEASARKLVPMWRGAQLN